jgi:3',5'-cyclic AMP phosphodiesterase CpdA
VRRQRKNLNQVVFNIVGLLVVVSMVAGGLLITLFPPSERTSSATATRPATAIPTFTPTVTATPIGDPVATPIPLGGKDEESFTFAVCGDSQGGNAVYGEILRRVEKDGVAFLVHTGNLVPSGQADQFQAFAELMSDFSLPFFPVPGNQDSHEGRLDEFLQYSGAPAAHYSFDYGLGHFVVADSHLGELSPLELAWLESDLASTDQLLKVIFLHHPPIDAGGSGDILRQGSDAFAALMFKYGVSHVFAGHIHAYAEATWDDVHYVVTGGAGAPLDTEEHLQAFHHYVLVTVNGTDISTQVIKVEPSGQ